MSKRDIQHLLILWIEQLKISTNDLPSMATKKVATAATSVSSTEAFPTTCLPSSWRCPRWWWLVSLAERWGRSAGLCINLKAVAAGIQLEEAVEATLEAAQLRETLPTTSWMLGPYENPVTWKFDSWMSKNLNSELQTKESYSCDPSKHGVEGSPVHWVVDRMGRGPQTA
jgi:hypothetical protein